MTLIETMIAIAVLAFGLMGVFASILATKNLFGAANERDAAAAAAQAKAEEIWQTPFAEVFGGFSSGSAGEFFAVPGLVVPAGRAQVGRVVLLRESASGAMTDVRNHGVNTYFGSAVDLNGDGDTADAPSAESKIHAIAIEIQYRSRVGQGAVESLVFPAVVGPKQQDNEE